MMLLDFYDVIEQAVRNIGKPAVYICNHETDSDILMEFVREVNKRYDAATCSRLINETFDEGLVVFETPEAASEFISIFDNETLFHSGLMAIMYDNWGNRVSTSIGGVYYS